MTSQIRSDVRSQETHPPADWASGLVVLSNCLRHPGPDLAAAIEDGTVRDTLGDTLPHLDAAVGTLPSVADRDLVEDYEALFGGFATPFAPPAESPYKPWYGNREGLMGGPPAADMEQRYVAIDAEFSEAYPPDHVALLLEYASILLEDGDDEAVASFVSDHLDWIDAFAARVEDARADAPFHRYCVDVLVETVAALRAHWGVEAPSEATVAEMVRRARTQSE